MVLQRVEVQIVFPTGYILVYKCLELLSSHGSEFSVWLAATAKAAAAAEKEKNDLDKQIKELMAKQAALSNPEAMQVDKEVKKIVNKATDMKGAAKKEEKKNDEKKVEKKADKKEVKKNEPKKQPPKAHAMPGKVSAELAKLYSKGAVAKGKIDEAALTQLASLPEKNGLQVRKCAITLLGDDNAIFTQLASFPGKNSL